MPMETTVTIAGNLGADPSLMRTENGPSRAYFRVAVTPRVRHPEKGWVDSPTTTWYSVTCWRALADHAKASLRKGDPVFVHGRMRSDTWTDQNGVVHETLAVEATCVGHDLSRGVSRFFRASQPSEEAPVMETDREASLAESEQAVVELSREELERLERDEDDDRLIGVG